LIQFDLILPVELQLANAQRLLLRKARAYSYSVRSVKLQIDKFPRYCRLLDFEEATTPDKEIGETLFPNRTGEQLRDAIRTNLAAARRWQDNYLTIALHVPAASSGHTRK
jgi:hypothetical protein